MIYLDNAATSFPKPEAVYQTLDRFARTSLANPGRASHRMAVAAEQRSKRPGTRSTSSLAARHPSAGSSPSTAPTG